MLYWVWAGGVMLNWQRTFLAGVLCSFVADSVICALSKINFLLVWSCETWTVHDQFHYCRMILVYWRFQECPGLSIDLSWSFVSSLLWVIVSLIDTYFYQRRKLNPYYTNTTSSETGVSSVKPTTQFQASPICKVAWSTYKLEKWNKVFSRQICIHNWLEMTQTMVYMLTL